MADRKSTTLRLKKEPKQARSNELVSTILEAALAVLEDEGAQRFTTARVAEKAGVSVGSLYQYFPNKASILFRLQSDEWRQTAALMREILGDGERAPLVRLRDFTHAFVMSECEEAGFRIALDDAAPLYRDAPEAIEARASGDRSIETFMADVLPDAEPGIRKRAGELIFTTLRALAKSFSEESRTPAEISAYADEMADMFCAFLGSLMRK